MTRVIVAGLAAGVSFTCGIVVAAVIIQLAEDRRMDLSR